MLVLIMSKLIHSSVQNQGAEGERVEGRADVVIPQKLTACTSWKCRIAKGGNYEVAAHLQHERQRLRILKGPKERLQKRPGSERNLPG